MFGVDLVADFTVYLQLKLKGFGKEMKIFTKDFDMV